MKVVDIIIRKHLLITLFIFTALVISSSASYAGGLVYSHQFDSGVTYCPGDPQYDNWLSFRASLPASGVQSITISGSQDLVGRTCSSPAIAQQIADAMRNLTVLSIFCDANTWKVGQNCRVGCNLPNNDLVLSAGGNTCSCSSTYNIRPGIGNENWGGITGSSCFSPTQTMTVEVIIGIEFNWDAKLCSLPNAFNCKRTRGSVPVTIFGSDQLDVANIDISSLRLALDSNPAMMTGAPISSKPPEDRGDGTVDVDTIACVQDIASPDGFDDLDVGFDAGEVGDLIGCAGLNKGDDSPDLIITGTLMDGTPLDALNVQVLTNVRK